MPDLANEFKTLIAAAQQGTFEIALTASALADRPAQRHPLNFVAIRVEDGKGLALRLHLWSDRFAFGQAGFQVHDHVFDLESYVVSGKLQQSLYETVPDDHGSLGMYEVHYHKDAALLYPVGGGIRLQRTQVDHLESGMRYSLLAGVLHRLEPQTPTATTLILTRAHAGRPLTIGPRGQVEAPRTERLPVLGPSGRPMTISNFSLEAISAAANNQASP